MDNNFLFIKYCYFPHILGTYMILRDEANEEDPVGAPHLPETTNSHQ